MDRLPLRFVPRVSKLRAGFVNCHHEMPLVHVSHHLLLTPLVSGTRMPLMKKLFLLAGKTQAGSARGPVSRHWAAVVEQA